MEMLSRSGNTAQSVNRKQSVLQQLVRCHTLIVRYPEKSPDVIANMASLGQELGFAKRAKVLIEYLIAQAGGSDGVFLRDLVRYEKLLQVKREIKVEDLQQMSAIDLQHTAPRYTTALFKAMLACPQDFCERGVCGLFVPIDFQKCKANGKLSEHVIAANELVNKAESLLAAYAFGLTQLQREKLIDDLEVRLVMHVHGKKCLSRPNYTSLSQIGAVLYQAAEQMHAHKGKLPVWTAIGQTSSTGESRAHGAISLLESNVEGRVADSTIAAKQFVVGALITFTSTQVGVFKIMSFTNNSVMVVQKPLKSL